MSSSAWNTWFQSQKEAVTNALDKTGDVISKAATSAAAANKKAKSTSTNSASALTRQDEPQQQNQQQQPQMTEASNTHSHPTTTPTTTNIFSSFTHMIDHTRAVIEQEQSKLLTSITAFTNPNTTPNSLLHQRPLHWPLDVDALRDMEVVYITNRIITCSHPYLDSAVDPTITAERKLQALAHLLHQRHDPNKYMIWNLSEVNNYNAAAVSHFNDQVLTFSFPGSPSPPLGLLLKLVVSMESWLQAEPDNVIVVHCLTGRGRSSLAVAALLCWTGEAQFTTSVPMALEYIAKCKQIHPPPNETKSEDDNNTDTKQDDANTATTDTTTNNNNNNNNIKEEDELTIPSQRRYGTYFTNMMEGIRPFQPPLILKRIILSQAPKFCRGPRSATATGKSPTEDRQDTSADVPSEDDPNVAVDDKDSPTNAASNSRMGCAPYLQIFKGGQLIFTTTPSVHSSQQQQQQATAAAASQQQTQNQMLPFCSMADGPISFLVDIIVQGDVLIRCRHVTPSKSRVSMFRAAFHTGYVPTPILRLKKSELDGACHDRRFANDFYVDVIFEPVQAETASQHLMMMQQKSSSNDNNDEEDDEGDAGDATKESNAKVASSDTATTTNSNTATPMESRNEARERRERATLSGFAAGAAAATGKKKARGTQASASATVTATAYDSMLHRDSRFWEVIAAKREKRQQQQAAFAAAAATTSSTDGTNATTTPEGGVTEPEQDLKFWGPTIGRKRDFSQATNATSTDGTRNKNNTANSADSNSFLSTPFSIGGEFDFLPPSSPIRNKNKSPKTREGPKVDSLMDALNALDYDDDALLFPADSTTAADNDKEDMEEIVFESDSSKAPANAISAPPMDPTPTIVSLPPLSTDSAATENDNRVETVKEQVVNSATPPSTASLSATDDMDDLLKDDPDVDAILGAGNNDGDIDLNDLDGLDDDDDDLEDLEKFLSQK